MSASSLMKIQALELSRTNSAGNFILSVLAQSDGENNFNWYRSNDAGREIVANYVADLIQNHIWNAPEDAGWLNDWRSQLEDWFEKDDPKLELYQQGVSPASFPMIILAQRQRN